MKTFDCPKEVAVHVLLAADPVTTEYNPGLYVVMGGVLILLLWKKTRGYALLSSGISVGALVVARLAKIEISQQGFLYIVLIVFIVMFFVLKK